MNKFYVYSDRDDNRALEFIEEQNIQEFISSNTHKKFNGVVIEANSFEDALKIYNQPACGLGEYMMADEPVNALVTDTELNYNEIANQLDTFKCVLMMKLAMSKIVEANVLINKVCEDLHVIYNKPQNMTPKQMFDRLSDEVKQQIKYNGESTKSG